MDKLIEALQILNKYSSPDKYPFHCEHDTFMVTSVNPRLVSEKDLARLNDLGFFVDTERQEVGDGDYFVIYL